MDIQGQAEERRIAKNRRSQIYWAEHKELIAQNRNVKIVCHCGLEVPKRHVEEHLLSKRHTKALKETSELIGERTNPDVAKNIMEFIS